MLRFLRIRRMAVIDAVEIEFGPGLNVLTGETGAGKSILLEAVGLLLGARASGDLVRTGEESASVEALFDAGRDEELLVAREITAQGRSRAFINGSLATAGALKDLSARLVELHGQHEHQTLLDPSTHVALLDGYGALGPQVGATERAFEAMRSAAADLSHLKHLATERETRLEIVSQQIDELDRAALKPGEDAELSALRNVLVSAERVERLCLEGYASLYERDEAVLPVLATVWRRVAELAALDSRFQPFLDARDGIKSQLEDLAAFLRGYAADIEASPDRQQQVEERLALLERLKRKYARGLADLIERRETLRRELADLTGADERLAALEAVHRAAREAYLSAANELSLARRRVASEFKTPLEALLATLAMERVQFEVRFADPGAGELAWGATGIDRAEFFLSTNPGEDLRPLARIASGGELSRVMLGIKTLTARSRFGLDEAPDRAPSDAAPSLIFDEVDAGIGGRVADVVGRALRTLGSGFQVLCITHLPQIAAHADAHYLIEKRVDGGRTQTGVRRLDGEDRVSELGRMLGGGKISAAVLASAQELLDAGRPDAKGEAKSKGESERAKAKLRR